MAFFGGHEVLEQPQHPRVNHGETLGKWSTNGEFSWVFYIELLVYGRVPTVHSSENLRFFPPVAHPKAASRKWHPWRRLKGPCWGVWHAKKWWFNHQTWELYMVIYDVSKINWICSWLEIPYRFFCCDLGIGLSKIDWLTTCLGQGGVNWPHFQKVASKKTCWAILAILSWKIPHIVWCSLWYLRISSYITKKCFYLNHPDMNNLCMFKPKARIWIIRSSSFWVYST